MGPNIQFDMSYPEKVLDLKVRSLHFLHLEDIRNFLDKVLHLTCLPRHFSMALQNGESKPKKRKLRDVYPAPQADETNGLQKKLSKEERREAKRARKLEKGKLEREGERNAVQLDGAGKAAGVESKDADAAKEARKVEKAQAKAAKKAQKEAKLGDDVPNGDRERPIVPEILLSASKQSQAGYTEHSALTALPQDEIDTFLETNAIAVNDPSSATPLRPITQFSHLPSTFDSSPFSTFSAPTPIQSAAWPFLLSGRDVIGVAETGSGKTLAFGVPLIRSITSSHSRKHSKPLCKAIVVSPTRELAVQIHTQLESLATAASLKTVCVYGGVPKDAQRDALRTAHIVVATPGRLNDLIDEGSADLSNVDYLVLDEADRMLDKGFEDEIRKIISTTKMSGRQTLMFTATWPESVRKLASTFMHSPVHISIGANNPTGELRANSRITQLVEVVDGMYKQTRLIQLLSQYHGKKNKDDRILIFCLYKKEAARIEDFLRRQGHSVAGIHGDMSQPARSASLDGFKSGKCSLLVATDVAARGLDIPAVKVVINVTFPLTVEDYVHRIGRTGRAGKDGLAITLFTDQDKQQAGGLINVLKAAKQDVPEELLKFGTTVKKKGHEAYGPFYKDFGPGEQKTATKIKF